MALKLRVISDHYKALGKRSSRLFGVTGGRIGRAQDNDWILPDPERYVSSHHCKVEFRAGAWVLEDTSTNGVFINGSDVPASVEGTYSLNDGDRLRLGDYEVLVSIDERNDFPSDASGQMRAPGRASSRHKQARVDEDLGEELDLTDLLSDAALKTPGEAPKPAIASAFDLGKALGIDLQATRPGTSANPTVLAVNRRAAATRHCWTTRPMRASSGPSRTRASQKTGKCRLNPTIASRCRR